MLGSVQREQAVVHAMTLTATHFTWHDCGCEAHCEIEAGD